MVSSRVHQTEPSSLRVGLFVYRRSNETNVGCVMVPCNICKDYVVEPPLLSFSQRWFVLATQAVSHVENNVSYLSH